MINKDTVFASAGTTAGSSASGYTTGMVPGTVAKAEDVNLYMGMSDQQLYAVCNEVANLLTDAGIVLDPNDYDQLTTWAKTKVPGGMYPTGIDMDFYTSAPTQNGNAISFPQMKVVFNTSVYYGKYNSTHQSTTLSAQTLSANSDWVNGVHYIYAETTPGSTTCTLNHQTDAISADTTTKCMLGSVFVINGAFQADSWKFQPWLQITSVDRRESPTAMTRGGFIGAASATTLKMGALEVMDEGINVDASQYAPNIKNFAAKSTYDYKFLYPGYDPSSVALTALDTTHIYNLTDSTWDTISAASNPSWIVLVPCIAPTGQTLMIPAMSYKSGDVYYSRFWSRDEAIQGLYSLPYDLGNVAKRVIYLGVSLIVQVGATNLQDPQQFITVGQLPQALAGFSSATGQSGGGVTEYRPMPMKTWNANTNFTAKVNAANFITISGSSNVTITMPTAQANVVNELEIYLNKTGTGNITWGTTINWYTGAAPTFAQNKTYNIILEYINGSWWGGVLGQA